MQETTTSITINTSQGKTEIIYNGVKYVPDPTIPNRMNIYLMRDNHTFIRVKGTTVTEIIENILATKLKNPDAKQGTLFLLHNDKEIKRYNIPDTYKYLVELLQRQDVQPLLHTNND